MTVSVHRSVGELALDVFTDLSARLETLRKKATGKKDPEDIHRIRVNLRKMRAAFTLFEPIVILPKGVTEKRIAVSARRFGRKRDNDVLIEKLKQATNS